MSSNRASSPDADIRAELAARRAELQLSQAAAGAACSPAISQQTISKMERGAAETGIETLCRYAAQALGCRVKLARR